MLATQRESEHMLIRNYRNKNLREPSLSKKSTSASATSPVLGYHEVIEGVRFTLQDPLTLLR